MDGFDFGAASATDMDLSLVLTGWAQLQPDHPAILAPGRSAMTYAALAAQQRDVGHALSRWGVRRHTATAVILPEGPELAVALAILPAAATVVPLAVNLTADDYGRLFERCGIKALILSHTRPHPAREAADRLGILQIDLASTVDGPAGAFELIASGAPLVGQGSAVSAPGHAYIVGTSGTTAERKLVPYRHAHIVSFASVMGDWYRFTPDDLNLHVMPSYLGHGLIFSLLTPLLRGATVVCLPGYDPESFFETMEAYNPTWMTAAFTIYRDIHRRAEDHAPILAKSRHRFLRSGAGRLENHEIEQLEQIFGAPLLVGLSCTEAIAVAYNPLPPRTRKIGSLGVPIGSEVRVCDPPGHSLGPGEEGEILTRGPMVFDGYLDDEAATKACFVDGWYRTGDLGYFDEDGYLYLTGRIKEIINSGGEKISPVEIDSILERHPDIAEAATFGLPHPTLGEVVVAAIVAAPGTAPDPAEIKQHVQAHVAGLKVPRKLFFVPALPRTNVGKIQRGKLPEMVTPAG